MNAGRPPLEPRIAKLEQELAQLHRQIAEMYEYFNKGTLPQPKYEQQFRVFPGANPNSNGNV